MQCGPFLSRELTTSVRSSRAFQDRVVTVLMVGAVVVGCFVVWDCRGWDRTSVVGAQRFALWLFVAVVAWLAFLGLGIVPHHVSSSIASERDRKTLDALLASQFESSEIVLGAIMSGLFRYAAAAVAGLPILVLVVFVGGIPGALLVLAVLVLIANAVLLGAFGVVASVGSRTSAQALNIALAPYLIWISFPTLFIMLRPLVWRGAPSWLIEILLRLVEGSPLGLVVNLVGMIPRSGGLVAGVGRLVAWELGLSVLLVIWAILRLRPASRGLYDVEGETTRIERIRAAVRRPPRRPACFDDPVLWYEIYSTRGRNTLKRLIGRTIAVVLLGCLACVIWWFAKPAFHEWRVRGYCASSEAFRPPEIEPFARVLLGKMVPKLATEPQTGQARLEFNIVLREFTGLFLLGFLCSAFQYAFESIKGEQRRDTWLGLIATALTAKEILRGKQLGSIWRSAAPGFLLLTLWLLGLALGAVHPLGFLAVVALLIIGGAFFSSLGLAMALQASHPDRPKDFANVTATQVLFAVLASSLMIVGPLILGSVSLFGYEDVQAMIQGRPFPEFYEKQYLEFLRARAVLGLWILSIGTFAMGAFQLDRANLRGFDQAIGRPTRSISSDTQVERSQATLNAS